MSPVLQSFHGRFIGNSGDAFPWHAKIGDFFIKEDKNEIWFKGRDSIWRQMSSGNVVSSPTAGQVYYNTTFDNVATALDYLFLHGGTGGTAILPPVDPSAIFNITPDSAEIGQSLSAINAYWTLNKNVLTASISEIGSVNGTAAGAHQLLNQVVSVFTDTTAFSIVGGDERMGFSGTDSVPFYRKRYWGTSSKTSLSGQDADIIAFSGELSTNYVKSWTMNGNSEYIYYCYPVSWGECKFYFGGFRVTLIKETISFTNAYGHTENYYTFRTQYTQAGTSIDIQTTA